MNKRYQWFEFLESFDEIVCELEGIEIRVFSKMLQLLAMQFIIVQLQL
jgi:hypothetical protein